MVYDLYEMNGPRTPEQCHDIFVKNVEYVYFDIKAMQSEIANEVSRSRSFFFFFFLSTCVCIYFPLDYHSSSRKYRRQHNQW